MVVENKHIILFHLGSQKSLEPSHIPHCAADSLSWLTLILCPPQLGDVLLSSLVNHANSQLCHR